jgi:hypothetical protein
MHASVIFSRAGKSDCRCAANFNLRRTRAGTSQGEQLIGLYCSDPATFIPNPSSGACAAADTAINATRAVDLGAGACTSHESRSKPAAWARDVTGPANPLHVSIWPLWRTTHKFYPVYGSLYAVRNLLLIKLEMTSVNVRWHSRLQTSRWRSRAAGTSAGRRLTSTIVRHYGM